MSLTSGTADAMELFGMPVFRGGGGTASRVLGWYAVAV